MSAAEIKLDAINILMGINSEEILAKVSKYLKTVVHSLNEETIEDELRPYTREELIAKAEEGHRQISMGNYLTTEELFKALNDEFGFATTNEQIAEAV